MGLFSECRCDFRACTVQSRAGYYSRDNSVMMELDDEHCFHVSENANIRAFEPRPDTEGKRVVWAIDAKHLANYLLPRDCPRICVRIDSACLLDNVPPPHARVGHSIVVERAWRETIARTELFVYTFSRERFTMVDENAGYLQAATPVTPLSVTRIDDLAERIAERGSYLVFEDSLWPIQDWVSGSGFEFSCIRMRNARPR